MGTIRTFIGVAVNKSIRNSAIRCAARLESSKAGYNWLAEDNIHVTLHFAVDIDEMEIPAFCREIKSLAAKHDPFQLSIRGLGAFPEVARPRVIWLGVEEGADHLRALHLKFAEVLREFGVNKEKNEYCPHLTLGRVRRDGRWNQALFDTMKRMEHHEAGECFIDEVQIYSSHLDRMGPTYSVMSTVELLGDED